MLTDNNRYKNNKFREYEKKKMYIVVSILQFDSVFFIRSFVFKFHLTILTTHHFSLVLVFLFQG